jgi:hypothetical protein
MKTNTKTKLFVTLLLVSLMTFAVAAPAFAKEDTSQTPALAGQTIQQEGDPKDDEIAAEDAESAVPISVDEAWAILVALIVFGLFGERGTQYIKHILRLIPHPLFDIRKDKSFVLSGVVAILAVLICKVDVTKYAEMFDNLGVVLPKIINIVLLMSAANTEHNIAKFFKNSAGTGRPQSRA